MISEPDTGQGASKEAKPRKRWTRGGVRARTLGPEGGIEGSHIDWRRERMPSKALGPEGRWIVRSHIDWRGEQSILYKGVETSP